MSTAAPAPEHPRSDTLDPAPPGAALADERGQAIAAAAAAARVRAAAATRRVSRLGWVRLAAFVALVTLAIYLLGEGLWWVAVSVVALGLAGFNTLVGRQEAAARALAVEGATAAEAERELRLQSYDVGGQDGGAEFADPHHAYTGDLDVFGTHSVFAMLNVTGSLVGREALAGYLREVLAQADLVGERQAAVAELGPLLAWRLGFGALGRIDEGRDSGVEALDGLRAWLASAPQLQERWWPVVFWGVSVVNVAWIVAFAYLPFMVALLGYVPTAVLLYRYKARVDAIQEQTEAAVAQLRRSGAMLAQIESRAWSSPLLAALRGQLDAGVGGGGTGAQVQALAYDARQLAIRSNPFVLLFNLFSLWELRYARRLERWKAARQVTGGRAGAFPAAAHFHLPTAVAKTSGSAVAKTPRAGEPSLDTDRVQAHTGGAGRTHATQAHTGGAGRTHVTQAHTGGAGRTHVTQTHTGGVGLTRAADVSGAPLLDRWLLALGAFDALTSMAGAYYRWPHWRFPEVSDATAALVGEGLHHPLLPPGRSVPNDFRSPLRQHVALLTGSNMAGKSTLLRTIGLHLVLAQAGMPTPARQLRLGPVAVYTSMRTQDDLHEGASAFYAELKRLSVVVEAVRGSGRRPVFFLLDEILKGTNSDDRNTGGRALVRQLLRLGGAGVVATHDLGLGELTRETDAVSTLRLEVETDAAGELYFDYTVKPGLAESRNASALMRRLGLGEEAE